MATTDVTIASRAMHMIGGQQFASFADDSNEAKVANGTYEMVVEAALTRTRWRFSSGQQQLSRLAAAPVARWDAAYQMPTSPRILLLHAVTILDRPIKYDRYEDKIYCNATADDTVVADYTYYVKEQYWPPHFVKAVTLDLASIFAGSLAQKGDIATYYANQAELAYRHARWAESSSQTAKNVRTSSLVDVRRS
jgi:hypothetical protein